MTQIQNSPLAIAFQGEPGAYSELAAIQHFGTEITPVPYGTFDEVFAAVQAGHTTHAVLPFENSLAGSIHRNYDLIQRHDLHIVSETFLRVNHCLLALPGVALNEIKQAHSHPQALAQCEQSLTELGIRRVIEADTAGSARLVQSWGDRTRAAIASQRAAEVYGLDILAQSLEDNSANYTRFLVLAAEPAQKLTDATISYKTSIVFSLNNVPGALFKALSVFALRDIDLTKIESRPIQNKTWEYLFYIDFIGHAEDEVCKRALDHLAELAAEYRVLGAYPRFEL